MVTYSDAWMIITTAYDQLVITQKAILVGKTIMMMIIKMVVMEIVYQNSIHLLTELVDIYFAFILFDNC